MRKAGFHENLHNVIKRRNYDSIFYFILFIAEKLCNHKRKQRRPAEAEQQHNRDTRGGTDFNYPRRLLARKICCAVKQPRNLRIESTPAAVCNCKKEYGYKHELMIRFFSEAKQRKNVKTHCRCDCEHSPESTVAVVAPYAPHCPHKNRTADYGKEFSEFCVKQIPVLKSIRFHMPR